MLWTINAPSAGAQTALSNAELALCTPIFIKMCGETEETVEKWPEVKEPNPAAWLEVEGVSHQVSDCFY